GPAATKSFSWIRALFPRLALEQDYPLQSADDERIRWPCPRAASGEVLRSALLTRQIVFDWRWFGLGAATHSPERSFPVPRGREASSISGQVCARPATDRSDGETHLEPARARSALRSRTRPTSSMRRRASTPRA